MKRILVLGFFVFVTAASNLHAQWAQSLGGPGQEFAGSVRFTSDGGIITCGWTLSYGAGLTDAWIVKMDASGNILWQRAYGSPDDDIALDIQELPGGGYIVLGSTYSLATSSDVWLLHLDESGNILWQKKYGTAAQDQGPSLLQTSDGGFILSGEFSVASGNFDMWVMKLTSSGSVQWQKAYGGMTEDWGNDIQELSTGGYVVAGGTSSQGAGQSDAWIVVLDSTGNIVSQKAFGGTAFDSFTSVKETPDGGLIATGFTDSFGAGNRDIIIVKLTSTLNLSWAKTYGGPWYDTPYTIALSTNNNYIVTAHTNSYGAGSYDIWALKLTENGDIVWQRTYGDVDSEENPRTSVAADGRMIISATTQSFPSGDPQFWILNLDSNGLIDPSCILATDTAIAPAGAVPTITTTTAVTTATTAAVQNTAVSPTPTAATSAQQCAVICIFCDEFDNGFLDATWTYAKPSWSESGGDLIATATKKALAVASPAFGGCTDCAFEAGMMSDGSAGNKMSMLAWYTDKGNNVEVIMKQQSGKFIVKQKAGGAVVAKTKALMNLQPNVSYDVRVEYDGTALHLIVNGTDIATVNAPSPASGTIALQAAKTTARFGHVLVE